MAGSNPALCSARRSQPLVRRPLNTLNVPPARGAHGAVWTGSEMIMVGLLILTIVGFIPYLGGLVRLGVVCLGLGAFAGQLHRCSRSVMTA